MKLKSQSTKAPKNLSKEKIKVKTQDLKNQLYELQNLLFAEGKHSLLIILQGLDASGKDGAILNVFRTINPAGCRVVSFKKPTEQEMKHDFLWRIHSQVPEKGMIVIFNRSQYEDVLIQKVHKWVDEKTITHRYEHINNFERLITQNNTVILKFFLYVSKQEQLERLNERMADPTKMWKYNKNDLAERKFWNKYLEAYEDAINHCSEVPWHVVPADQNWYKEFLIADTVVKALKNLKMKYPAIQK